MHHSEFFDIKHFRKNIIGSCYIDGKFKKVNVELGLSDGINVEIVDGLKEGDKVKVWNEAKEEEEEEDN